MYIILTITATDYTSQLYTDVGVVIGGLTTLDKDLYRLDITHPTSYRIVLEGSTDKAIPAYREYPRALTLLVTT